MSGTTITDSASIAAFNRGPLTTVFTPPLSCLSTLTETLYFGHYGGFYDSSCYPPNSAATIDWELYYYSPGQCPSGWAHATTFTSTFIGANDAMLSIGADTTVILCCPSGYFYLSESNYGDGHLCTSTLSSGMTYLAFSPSTSNNDLVAGNASICTAGGNVSVIGDGIPVWYQNSDLAAFATTASTSSATSSRTAAARSSPSTVPTPTSTTTPATASNTPSNTPSPESSGGLSVDTKIAIAAVVQIVFIAAALALIWFLWRRRYRDRLGQNAQVHAQLQNMTMAAIGIERDTPETAQHLVSPVEIYGDMYREPQMLSA